ncbi:hypothetical protein STRAU_2690 [Streptomyces aurantiacus JA 4570]|uniref:Uncharacterized protein n=1 Tax=Streptomyces aurantiacus JA 4570 TaxID=1286094 RepID=S4A0K9_9ACTN|nr:hypothetical protein STRAU_2690 [Streptomyces aurantiacus JA 4570]
MGSEPGRGQGRGSAPGRGRGLRRVRLGRVVSGHQRSPWDRWASFPEVMDDMVTGGRPPSQWVFRSTRVPLVRMGLPGRHGPCRLARVFPLRMSPPAQHGSSCIRPRDGIWLLRGRRVVLVGVRGGRAGCVIFLAPGPRGLRGLRLLAFGRVPCLVGEPWRLSGRAPCG